MRWVVLPLLMMIPSTVIAAPRFEITPTTGYQWGNGIVVEEKAVQFETIQVDSSAMGSFDLKMDIRLFGGAFFEVMLARHDGQLEDKDSLFGSQPGGPFPNPEKEGEEVTYGSETHLLDMKTKYYHAGLLWELNQGSLRGFIVGTAGMTSIHVNLPLPDSDCFSATLGAGLKQDLSKRLGVRLEGRLYWTDSDESISVTEDYTGLIHPRDCKEPCTYTYSYDDSLNQGQISLGLIFRPF